MSESKWSIRSTAYQLCKSVRASGLGPQVRELLDGLNVHRESRIGAERIDRSSFGYVARQIGAQFLGYLLADIRRGEFAEAPLPIAIPNLSDEERLLLRSAHAEIVRLNRHCIAAVTRSFPGSALAIDPYSSFAFGSSPEADEALLDQDHVDTMAQAFAGHPAVEAIAATRGFARLALSPEQQRDAVRTFTNAIARAGVLHPPADLERVMISRPPGSPEQLAIHFLSGLTCLRSSLVNLDQLVYQAVLSDKLPLLCDDNIIDIGNISTHLCGTGTSILYQPDKRFLFPPDLGLLVLVKLSSHEAEIGELWNVEGVETQFGQTQGFTEEISIREVDENLNPFAPLLAHV